MENIQLPQLPFVTREMLEYGNISQFDLHIAISADASNEIHVIGATRDGVFTWKITPVGDMSKEEFTFPLSNVPLWVSVIDAGNNFVRGEVYARLSLRINGDIVRILTAGYVDKSKGLTFPGGVIESALSGRGQIEAIQTADPAAGSDITHTFASTKYTKIRSLWFILATDATVTNRTVTIAFEALAGFPGMFAISEEIQTASQSIQYYASPIAKGATSLTLSKTIAIPPDIVLGPGGKITVSAQNLQAGDNFGIAIINTETWHNV